MTTVHATRPIPELPTSLPLVERRAALPAGFAAGGAAIGIKASGRPDLVLIRTTDGPAAAAAVFTPNAFAAAPVKQSQANLAATSGDPRGRHGWAEVVISTSGSANAATGPAGDADQAEIGRIVSAAAGVAAERVLHLSTGIIGTRLPLDRVAAGVASHIPALTTADAGLAAAAEALRTTDSVTKLATTSVELPAADGGTVQVTVSGIAKGVGMIHPRMATMLAVVLTDAAVEPAVLAGLLRPAAVRTWNQLSVDGDTSTNDTVFVLASGKAGNEPSRAGLDGGEGARRSDRGGRPRSGTSAGRRRRGGGDADHLPGVRRARRCRGTGGGAGGGVVEPAQGGGPRPRPELGPHRRRSGERRAGRCRGARGRRTARGGGGGTCRHPGRTRPGPVADRDRRPPRVRRHGRRPGRLRPRGGTRRDGCSRAPDPPRPGTRRAAPAKRSAAT